MAKRKRKTKKRQTNTGKPYEGFVGDIYAILLQDERFTNVERDVFLVGPDGTRQFDLLLRAQRDVGEILTVIECREYNKVLDITHVDGLHSKMGDFGVNGVLVSRKGFSKKARNKAERVGITLCLASTAKDVCNFVDVRIPISVQLVQSTIHLTGSVTTNVSNQEVAAINIINGVNLFSELASELLDGTLEIPDTTTEFDWFPKKVSQPYTVWSSKGEVEVKDIACSALVLVRFYFGYLDSVPELTTHHDLSSSATTVLYTADQGQEIVERLLEVGSAESIPAFKNGFRIRLIAQPQDESFSKDRTDE